MIKYRIQDTSNMISIHISIIFLFLQNLNLDKFNIRLIYSLKLIDIKRFGNLFGIFAV